MQFNNRPNQAVYLSRSVVVLAVPMFKIRGQNTVCVPLARRSEKVELYRGFLGLPCGYLDWDESASEAVIREVWEELGIALTQFGAPMSGSLEQPYFVFSDPAGDEKQNVTLRFRFQFEVDELPPLRDSDEATDCQWVEVRRAAEMDLAFNHVEILNACI